MLRSTNLPKDSGDLQNREKKDSIENMIIFLTFALVDTLKSDTLLVQQKNQERNQTTQENRTRAERRTLGRHIVPPRAGKHIAATQPARLRLHTLRNETGLFIATQQRAQPWIWSLAIANTQRGSHTHTGKLVLFLFLGIIEARRYGAASWHESNKQNNLDDSFESSEWSQIFTNCALEEGK